MMNGRDYQEGDITTCLHCGQEVIVDKIVDDCDYYYDEEDHSNDKVYFFESPNFKHTDPDVQCKSGCGAMGNPSKPIIRSEQVLRRN